MAKRPLVLIGNRVEMERRMRNSDSAFLSRTTARCNYIRKYADRFDALIERAHREGSHAQGNRLGEARNEWWKQLPFVERRDRIVELTRKCRHVFLNELYATEAVELHDN